MSLYTAFHGSLSPFPTNITQAEVQQVIYAGDAVLTSPYSIEQMVS